MVVTSRRPLCYELTGAAAPVSRQQNSKAAGAASFARDQESSKAVIRANCVA